MCAYVWVCVCTFVSVSVSASVYVCVCVCVCLCVCSVGTLWHPHGFFQCGSLLIAGFFCLSLLDIYI